MSRAGWNLGFVGVLALGLSGCGGAGEPGTADSGAAPQAAAAVAGASTEETDVSAGVTASIDAPKSGGDVSLDGASSKKPASGSETQTTDAAGGSAATVPDDEATKTLKEIQQLRIAAVPADLDAAKAARKERNERIIEMATRVITMTVKDEARKAQFHQAIGQLLEARFQMALVGGKEEADALYADVQALNDRDPKSLPAAEGVYYAARFAHTRASMIGKTHPVWFETLSRWAREFADRFPEQQQRATSLLFGAARSCELHALAATDKELSTRLMTESRLCYTTLAEKFPKSEQGQEAVASLRRMELPGQRLSQFSGPTADGGFVSSDEFAGKPTLIYFWDSENDEFTENYLPALTRIRSQLPAERLRIIGVALDEEESALNSYMETHDVPGQQIFFPNQDQRSWNSPLIRFWGIASEPGMWLVDSNGVVMSTNVTVDQLVPMLQKALKK